MGKYATEFADTRQRFAHISQSAEVSQYPKPQIPKLKW